MLYEGVVELQIDDATQTIVTVENPQFKCVKPYETSVPVNINDDQIYIQFEGKQSSADGICSTVRSVLDKAFIYEILKYFPSVRGDKD